MNQKHGELSDTSLLFVICCFYCIYLAGLSIQENDVQGSLDELCDVMYDRRFEFESYLTLKMEADCLGNSPKVYCECCSTCH